MELDRRIDNEPEQGAPWRGSGSRKRAFSEQLGVHLTEVFESGEAGGGWRPITGERLDWEKGYLEFYGGSGFFRDYSDGDDGEDADVFTFSTDDDAVIIDAAWKAVDYANGNLASLKQADAFYPGDKVSFSPGGEQATVIKWDPAVGYVQIKWDDGQVESINGGMLVRASRKVALDWSSVQEKVEQSGWDQMYADYIAWALDNGKNVEDTYSFVDYSDLLGLDAEEEQLLKKFIQNTAPRLYGSRKTAGLKWDTEEENYWSYTSPDSGLDYWIKKDPADYNNYYGGFAWSVFDYLAGEGDRGNAQSFDEAEQSIENFIDSQSPNAALDYLGSRKEARDTWDDWVNRMEDEEAAGTGYGSTPGWHVDLPNESSGDEDIDNPDSENPGRFSRRKTALDIDGSWEEELLGIGYASCTPKAGGGFELYMWSDSKQSEALDVVGTSEEARRIWKEWRGSDTPPAGNAFNTDDNYFL